MWIKGDNGESYLQLGTNALLAVEGSGSSWRIQVGSSYVVRSGYATKQDAMDALDAVMVPLGYIEIPAP